MTKEDDVRRKAAEDQERARQVEEQNKKIEKALRDYVEGK